jgi:apolipoprotein N-acyltransferase
MGDGITGGSQINPETPRVPADSPRALFAQNHGPIIFAVAWTAFEFFKSRGYLAFPWNLAAFPFHEILLFNQVADFGGVYLISFAVFLFQGAAGELIHDPNIPPRLSNPAWGYRFASVALILLFAVYGALRIADYSGAAFLVNDRGDDSPGRTGGPQPRAPSVLLVQQNVDSWAAADPNEGLRTAIDLSPGGHSRVFLPVQRAPPTLSPGARPVSAILTSPETATTIETRRRSASGISWRSAPWN